MSERFAVAASQSGVAEIASSVGGRATAIDRVVAGVLGGAALHPSVLFGSVQILIGGGGVGLFAIDGRARQPGKDAPRPRGFRETDRIPDAAYVAVPLVPSALAATMALVTGGTLTQASAPAAEAARAIAPGRARVIELFGRRGAALLEDESVAADLLAAGGRLEGGNLTPEDLASARAEVAPAAIASHGKIRFAGVPWAQDGHAMNTQIVAAADLDGRFAVAVYEAHPGGITIPDLELRAAPLAIPVRRGEPRVSPGAALSTLAPMQLVERGGILEMALGLVAAPDALALLAELGDALGGGLPLDAAIRAPRGSEREAGLSTPGRAYGVVRAKGATTHVGASSDPRARA